MTRKTVAQHVLQELIRLQKERRRQGDFAGFQKVKKDISEFKRWMNERLSQPCPVDLASYPLKTRGWQNLMKAAPPSTLSEDVEEQPDKDPTAKKAEVLAETPPLFTSEAHERWKQRLVALKNRLQKGDFEHVRTEGRKWLSQRPPSPYREGLAYLVQQAEQNLRGRWMQQALEARKQGEWEQVLHLAERILVLNPKDAEAQALRKEAQEALEQSRFRSRLDEWTEQAEALWEQGFHADIGALEKQVRTGEALQREGEKKYPDLMPHAPKFQDLLTNLRRLFDEKRRRQSQVTTADAVGQYETVARAIEEMEQALRAGQKHWFDDRTGSIRPIYELLDDYRARLPELAKEVAMRYQTRAQEYLKRNKPQEALEEIEQALALKALPTDMRDLLERLQIQAQDQAEAYHQAEDLIQKALRAQDPREGWRLLQEAQGIFPAHEGLPGARAQVRHRLALWWDHRLQEIEQEVLQALLQQQQFNQARALLGRIKSELLALLSEQEAEPWLKDLERLEQRVRDAERQRHAIDTWIEDIRAQIKRKEIAAAWERFRHTLEDRPEWEQDPAVRLLREELRAKLDDTDRLEEARRLYRQGNLEEAGKVLEGLLETLRDPNLQKEARALWGEVILAQTRARIRRLRERGEYREIERLISRVSHDNRLPPEQQQAFLQEMQPLLQHIEELRSHDPEVFARLQMVGIADEDALSELLRQIPRWPVDHPNKLDPAWSIYQVLKEVSEQPSTLQGTLREGKEQMADWLRRAVQNQVTRWAKEQRWEEVETWLERWRQEWPVYEREWYERMYTHMYTAQAQQAQRQGDWQRVETLWEKAYQRLQKYHFLQEHQKAHQNALLQKLYSLVQGKKPREQVQKVYQELKALPHINDEVRLVSELLNGLHEIDEHLEKGQVYTLVSRIRSLKERLSSEWPADAVVFRQKEVERLLNQRVEAIYRALLSEGDHARGQGDVIGAMLAYGQASLLPVSVAQRKEIHQRLQPYKGETALAQIHKFRRKVEQWRFDPDLDLREQRLSLVNLQHRMAALMEMLPLFLEKEAGNQERRLLEKRLYVLRQVEDWLKRADELVQQYQVEAPGSRWMEEVREGRWEHIENQINKLLSILRSFPPEVHQHLPPEGIPREIEALRQRIRELRRDKERLEDQIRDFHSLWQQEAFPEALQRLNELYEAIEQLNIKWKAGEGSYFRAFLEDALWVWDPYNQKMLKGQDLRTRLEQLKTNQDKWVYWKNRVEKIYHEYQSSYEELKSSLEQEEDHKEDIPRGITYQQALSFKEAAQTLAYQRKQLTAARPEEQPISRRAQEAQGEGDDLLDRLGDMQKVFQEGYARYFRDPAWLIRGAQIRIAQGQYREAIQWIDLASGYWKPHSFLRHLSEVAMRRYQRGPAKAPWWAPWRK